MTLLVDPNLPEPLTIGDRKYQIKPPEVTERTRWRRAIAASGGRQHGAVGLLTCLSKGVRSLMADSDPAVRDAVLKKVAAQRERVAAFFQAAQAAPTTVGELTEAERDTLNAFTEAGIAMNEGDADLAIIVAEVTEAYPAYGQMVADDATYWQIAGIEAARMFLVGWEGFPIELARGAGGVAAACLAEIPEGHFASIGQAMENLVRVTPQQRKNLLSPRPSSSAGETSST